MPSVLLGGLPATDPAGSRAVRDAVLHGLPNHELLETTSFADLRSLTRAARRSDGIVVTGTPFPRAAVGAAAISTAARCPLAFVGVSTGQLPGRPARTLARRAVGRADLLLLADEQSAGHLADAGAPIPMRVSADPAWLALQPPRGTALRGESVAVVLDGLVAPPVEAALASALITVARTGRRVRIVPWGGSATADAAMASRLIRSIVSAVPGGAALEPAPITLADASSLVADAHAVVALRYRAIHAAAAAGVPVIAIPVEPRTAALAGRLVQPTVLPLDLSASLPIALEQIGPATVPNPAAVQGEMARARAGMSLLRLVLEPDAVAAGEVDHLPLVPVPWLS